MYMMTFTVHLMANAANRSEAPDVHDDLYITVHLTANVVYRSEAPDVHDGICSTLVGKCCTPK